MAEQHFEDIITTRMEENHRLRLRIDHLERELAKARKNSGTSSKPPSSDLVKPAKPSQKPMNAAKRSAGGQPGHPKQKRPAFPPEQVHDTGEHTLDICPCYGTDLKETDKAPRIIQQVEIREFPIHIEDHRGYAFWCPHGRTVHDAPLPLHVIKGGLCGPRLTVLVASMKGVCCASFSPIRKCCRDVLDMPVSRSYLRNVIAKVADALEPAFDELLHVLPAQATLHIDETGHKENGDRFWTWCFKVSMYTLFRLDHSRGSQVLLDVLGEAFNGVIGVSILAPLGNICA